MLGSFRQLTSMHTAFQDWQYFFPIVRNGLQVKGNARSALSVSVVPGDYVLRDSGGGPRGMVRVMMKWKYPFQPSVDTVLGRQDRAMESSEREERRREKAEALQKPIAKPRVKVMLFILVFKVLNLAYFC